MSCWHDWLTFTALIAGGALPLARHHRKLLNQRIEGGSGFNAPVAESMGGPFAGGMTATIGSGGGSNGEVFTTIHDGLRLLISDEKPRKSAIIV